jgi:hypothetical protein
MSKDVKPTTAKPWSNEVEPPEPAASAQDIDAMNPREKYIADLAEKEKAKGAEPVVCDVTNVGERALRVIHNFWGQAVPIEPGKTQRIRLHPNLVAYLRNDKSLRLEQAAA